MKREFVLKAISGLGVIGLVAAGLATVPLADTPSALIPAGAVSGFPWGTAASAQQALLASASEQDSGVLEKAFGADPSELLGSRVLDMEARDPASRINALLSSEAIDSTILHPDEVFSFNDIVGVRAAEKGYQPGLMFANGQVITGIGGGICITSTLIYQVALETGMKIIERHPHSGPVAYADPGRDSAVAYGSLDLKFKNNTGAPVLIRSVAQNGKLVVAFYGTSQPGREIEIVTEDYEPIPYEIVHQADASVPEGETVVDQKGRPGHSVTTVRVVRKGGKVVSREMISRDVVRPRNEVVLVHADAQDGTFPAAECMDLLTIPAYTPTQRSGNLPLPLPEMTQPGAELPKPGPGSQGDCPIEPPTP